MDGQKCDFILSSALRVTTRLMLFLSAKLKLERSFCIPDASINDVAVVAELVSHQTVVSQ